jgi:glycosyltransferase involved in cell wall biosynthesis
MLKLAFISTLQLRDPWGGSEELWSQAAMRLVREGYPITVCVHRFPVVPPPVRALEEAGCHIHFRRPGTLTFKVLKRVIPGLASRWLDRVRPDLVVVAQGANLDGVDWMLACIDRNIPYVIISQAALDLEFPDESLANAALRGYTQARRSYFVSEGNVRTTQRQIGGPVPGALVVRNPFKVNYDARPAWPDETVWRLACVGRLSPDSKGQDLLLDLLSTETWRQRPVRLTLYGQGAYRYGFERIIQERGLAQSRSGPVLSIRGASACDRRGDAMRSAMHRHEHRRKRRVDSGQRHWLCGARALHRCR